MLNLDPNTASIRRQSQLLTGALLCLALWGCGSSRAPVPEGPLRPISAEELPPLPADEEQAPLPEDEHAPEKQSEPEEAPAPGSTGYTLTPRDIERELPHLFGVGRESGPLPEGLYAEVAKYVHLYSVKAKDTYTRWLTRKGRYQDLILSELKAQGLPEDLIYLVMIESGFNPNAVSSAKATGLWQFMRGTGKDMGLRIDDWVDERRDPVRSTRAAVKHLRWLHNQTGDWALSAAAYNAGVGRVSRTQESAGEQDYFRLIGRGFFARETQEYVPRILAAALVGHNPERFDITPPQKLPPFVYDSVSVPERTRFSAVAQAARTTEEALKDLNPHLIKRAAPPGGSYFIRVPRGSALREFSVRLAALDAERRTAPAEDGKEIVYTIKSGDSWWALAKKHNTTIRELKKANPGVKDLIVGRTLKIRTLTGSGLTSKKEDLSPSTEKKAETPEFQPLPGDTSAPSNEPKHQRDSSAAKKPSEQKTKESKSSSSVRERLEAAVSSDQREVVHVVAAGETLSGIAAKYDVRMSEVVEWNGMERARPLRIGEKLKLYPSSDAAASSKKDSSTSSSAPEAKKKEPKEKKEAKESKDSAASSEKKSAAQKEASVPKPEKKDFTAEHVVTSGETLSGIAKQYGRSVSQLVLWNDMGTARPIRVGERLRIRPPEPKRHEVRSGETLTSVAREYGVSLSDLIEWNDMEKARPLRLGEKLIVSLPER